MRKFHMLLPSRNVSTHLSAQSTTSLESAHDFRGWNYFWMSTIEVRQEIGGDELAVAFPAVGHGWGCVGWLQLCVCVVGLWMISGI